jgi:tetratricopeptide (TPR) repeat protein
LAAPRAAAAESAKEAYARGLSLYAAGSYQEAADAFQAAYAIKHKPLILFNIGQAYRKKGDFDRALTHYRRFLDEATPEERAPLEDEVRKYVREIEAEQALKRSLIEKADAEEASKLEFAKPATAPATGTTAPAATTAPATTLVTTAPAATTEKQPVYKKWWLWTIVGAAAAGVAIGVGVGVGGRSGDPSTALGTRTASF